mmetsp:Transcript_42608/g.110089  ORF Transcript_42608/g.110089 Transcript_42608/m.110089 type:complete len:206 (+) Transcript_42608:1393-2010(+)
MQVVVLHISALVRAHRDDPRVVEEALVEAEALRQLLRRRAVLQDLRPLLRILEALEDLLRRQLRPQHPEQLVPLVGVSALTVLARPEVQVRALHVAQVLADDHPGAEARMVYLPWLCASLQQGPGHIRHQPGRREVQRRRAAAVLLPGIRTTSQDRARRVELAALDDLHQRSHALEARAVRVCSGVRRQEATCVLAVQQLRRAHG